MRTNHKRRGLRGLPTGIAKTVGPTSTRVLLSLGVSGDGGVPLRLGVRDGNRSDSVETPLAIAECLALGLEGCVGSWRIVRPRVAARWG
jgi:hypothetical protein